MSTAMKSVSSGPKKDMGVKWYEQLSDKGLSILSLNFLNKLVSFFTNSGWCSRTKQVVQSCIQIVLWKF